MDVSVSGGADKSLEKRSWHAPTSPPLTSLSWPPPPCTRAQDAEVEELRRQLAEARGEMLAAGDRCRDAVAGMMRTL